MTDIKNSTVSKLSIWINKQHAKPKSCQSLAESITINHWDSIKTELSSRNLRDVRNKLKACIAIIIGSFAKQVSLGFEPKNFLAIPVGHSNELPEKLTGFKGKDLRLALKILKKLNLVECTHSGINSETITIHGELIQSSAVGRYKATISLLRLLEEQGLIIPNYPKGISFKSKETINLAQVKLLKDKYIPLPQDPANNFIKWFREQFNCHRITLKSMSLEALQQTFNYKEHRSKLQPSSKALVRTYSGNTSRYGRFHLSCIQSIPSEAREHLQINGNKTVELDYRSMHLNLIYHLSGSILPKGDPYTPPQGTNIHRDTVKEVFTRLTNESNEKAFWSHIKGQAVKYGKGVSLKEFNAAYEWLMEKHPVVEDFAFGRNEKDLFLEESKIALNVLEQLKDKNIFALPIHESFIVMRKHEAQLLKAMTEAFPGCPIH